MTADDVRTLTPLPEDLRQAFDTLTPDDLRRRGSLKWSAFDGAIGAWVAEMDLGTAPVVMQALRDALDRSMTGYMPGHVARKAVSDVARYYTEEHGWQVPEKDVSLLPDVLSALRSVIEHHTRAGSAVIVPTPAYMPFLSIPGSHGRECLQVPALRGNSHEGAPAWGLDLDAIEQAMADGAGLLVLCNPWNPVGRVLSAQELDGVAALSRRYRVPVFSDEIHCSLVLEPQLRHVPYGSRPDTDPDLTFTATATSKGWNVPGLRCAQLIASDGARGAWDATSSSHLAMEASALGAIATSAALSPEGLAWNEGVRTYVGDNRDLAAQVLGQVEGVRLTAPQGTYLAWLDCSGRTLPQGLSPMAYLLSQAGVATNAGEAFGTGYESFVRLNLATGRGVELETVRRLSEALAALPLA